MTVEITLAGEVAIRRHDRSLAGRLAGVQARAVFAVLVLEGAEGVPRDRLAYSLWSNELPKTWDSALRTAVSRVRSFAAEAFPDVPDVLTYDGGRYVLRLPGDVVVDVDEAERSLAAGRERLAAGDPGAALRLATDATRRARAPFLPGLTGDWADARRDRLDIVLVSALETMSQASGQLGLVDQARSAADEAVERAPLRESAHRCRMAAHAAAGNRAEALRAYQQLRRVLVDELGVDPSPETESAYLDLLGSPPPEVPRDAAGSDRGSGPRSLPPAAPDAVAGAFVGREAELAILGGLWNQAITGSRRLVLVAGEAGIGKTSLAREAARRASAEGGLVLFGRCDDPTVPYQPFVEAFDPMVATAPTDERPRLSEAAWRQLATILPSLDAKPGHGGPPTAPTGRIHLFDAITVLTTAVAAGRPTLLILDDLHWADTDTLLLLRHLVRHAGHAPILVVATMRNHDLASYHTLRDVVRTLDRDGWLHRLPLRGLDVSEVQRLVAATRRGDTGDPPADELARRLVAETAGNPFFIVELLRSGRPAVGHIPDGVHQLVAARLSRLNEAALDLLRASAVAGPQFSLDIVAFAAGLDELTALDALDRALDSGLLTEEAPNRYRFVHDILRRCITSQLSDARGRRLHRRLADAVESLRASELAAHAAIVAHHRAMGAPPDGDARAVHWARLAARRAEEANAPAEAVRLYRQAIDHVPSADDDLRAEVLVDLGVALLRCGDRAGYDALDEGAALARRRQRFDIVAQAELALPERAGTGDIAAPPAHPAHRPGNTAPPAHPAHRQGRPPHRGSSDRALDGGPTPDNLLARITADPRTDLGNPTIRRTGIGVGQVLGWLADGASVGDVLADHPELARDDVQACLAYGAWLATAGRTGTADAP